MHLYVEAKCRKCLRRHIFLQASKGLSYDLFLRMVLTFYPEERLAMGGLDVIEGELRQTEGCEKIHVDHCIEKLTAQFWMEDMELERSYQYE